MSVPNCKCQCLTVYVSALSIYYKHS